jgi:hypothetical protein
VSIGAGAVAAEYATGGEEVVARVDRRSRSSTCSRIPVVAFVFLFVCLFINIFHSRKSNTAQRRMEERKKERFTSTKRLCRHSTSRTHFPTLSTRFAGEMDSSTVVSWKSSNHAKHWIFSQEQLKQARQKAFGKKDVIDL